MTSRKSPPTVSVDSETGHFWHGKNRLLNRTEIKSAIELALTQRVRTIHCADQNKSLLRFAASQFFRTVGSFTEQNR